MTKYIIYYRVSTKKQQASHLGLDAQQAAVMKFLNGAEVVATFTEIESGREKDRPKLAEALKLAKATGATLLVARLDRLARNVSFTSALLDADVDFVCADMPGANRMTIQFMSILAENYALSVKSNTKLALAELKEKGVKLGAHNPNIAKHLFARAGKYQRPPSVLPTLYAKEYPAIQALRSTGKTYKQIADYLNEHGHKSSEGNPFSINLVHRIIKACQESTSSSKTLTTSHYPSNQESSSSNNVRYGELVSA